MSNEINISPEWESFFKFFLDTELWDSIVDFLEMNQSKTIYPERSKIFNAFNFCPPDKLKVVIIGQDPYHGPNQANGLAFSVAQGNAIPPSLSNIFKEYSSNLNLPTPYSGDLTNWAKEGVLLLNATLTVEAHKPNSHSKIGWQQLTDSIIKEISHKFEHVIFVLWGGFAQKKSKLIDKNKHQILTSGHPSPLSANQGKWFGNNHFNLINKQLKEWGESPNQLGAPTQFSFLKVLLNIVAFTYSFLIVHTTHSQSTINYHGIPFYAKVDTIFEVKSKAEFNKSIQETKLILYKQGHLGTSVDSSFYSDSLKLGNVYWFTGTKFQFGEISFNPNLDHILAATGNNLKNLKGKPVRPATISAMSEDLLVHLENTGFPFATIKLENPKIQEGILQAELNIDKGPLIKIDSTPHKRG